MSYITKEQWTEAMNREIPKEELERFRKAMKPLMDMSPKERAEFLKMQPRNEDEE